MSSARARLRRARSEEDQTHVARLDRRATPVVQVVLQMAVADAELELLGGLGLGVGARTRVRGWNLQAGCTGLLQAGCAGLQAGCLGLQGRLQAKGEVAGCSAGCNLEEGVVLEHVERVEDVEVEPLGEDERVVEQVSQRGLVGEEVVAVGGAQQRVLVVAEDGRGERVEGDLVRVRVRVRARVRARARLGGAARTP